MTNRHSRLARLLIATSALTSVAAPALAQTADPPSGAATAAAPGSPPPSDPPAADESTIVVTGSRIERRGYDAPTPTVVLGIEDLEKRAPARVIELLGELPQFYNNNNTSSQGVGSTNPGGQSFANMRSLGTNRTLVLVNGQRFVPTTATGVVDVALLPEILINRIDVVTGGASAAYGSDAVAGVLNFSFDTKMKGLRATAQAGITDESDGGNQKIGIAYGGDITDRLSVVAGGEYFHAEGVLPNSRSQSVVNAVANPAYVAGNGQPALLLRNYAYEGRATFGGLIVGGPLANTQFLPGGQTAPYTPCSTLSSNALQICPGPANLPYKESYEYLETPSERYNAYARLTYRLSNDTSIYVDGLYAKSTTSFNSVPPYSATYGLKTISRDNPYLPADIVARMTAAGVTSFTLGSGFDFLYPVQVSRDNEVKRVSGGFEGKLGGTWKLDGYATYGRATDDFTLATDTVTDRFNKALDAVRNSAGQIVCRSTLTDPTNGCVPINVFGGDQVSQAAKDYIVDTGWAHLVSQQIAAAVNISGEPVSTWAGPVSVAAGLEYRDDKVSQTTDPISAARGFANGNPAPFSGSDNVKEAYGEVVVPLAKDTRFLENLELNAAGRITDYSYSGTVETWKLGVNYMPVQGLRFRATRSRDIRAPNIVELFSGGARAAPTVVDNGVQQRTISYPVGNPDLKPEKADTTAAGVVLEPDFLRGFHLSVDYYRIKIAGSIGAVTAQSTLDFCAAGDQLYCSQITRDSAGNLVSINLPRLNVGTLDTSGLDFDLQYAYPLSSQDRVTFRALATHMFKYKTQSDVSTTQVDSLGVIQPRWTGTASVNYSGLSRSVFVSMRYLGPAVFSNDVSTTPDLNHIKSQVYVNTTLEQKISVADKEMRLFLNIKNLFDKQPPYGFAFDGTNYDIVGRRFVIGVRLLLK